MIHRHSYNGVSWIDIESPSADELRSLIDEEDIDPRIAEELADPTPEPKLEYFENAIFLILHFPAVRHTHQHGKNQEVDLVITPRTLITVRYDTIDAVHKFGKLIEREYAQHNTDTASADSGRLGVALLQKLYGSVQHELESVRDELTAIEQNIFSGREKEMVFALSDVSRELLNIEQTIVAHEDILLRLHEHGSTLFDTHFPDACKTLHGTYQRIRATITHRKNSFHELRETNDSLLSTKQNEIMKTLTILAFVTFPLTLITNIFSMNTAAMPIIGHPHDFWLIIGIMLFLTVLFFAYFKHKQWL